MAKRRNNVHTKPATEDMTAKELVEEVGKPLAEGVADGLTKNFETELKNAVEEKEPDVLHAKVANCKKVRARKNPTTDEDNVIDELEEGKVVIVLDSSNPDWTRVELAGGIRAWIMSKYLEVI